MLHKLVLSKGMAPSKTSVFFFHGFMGDHKDYLPIAKRLLKDWPDDITLVLFDLPGHGASLMNFWKSLDQLITHLAHEISAFKSEDVFCMGYSMGGRVLASLMAAFPDLVQKAIFESCSFGIESESLRMERFKADQSLLNPVIEKEQSFELFLRRWYGMNLFSGLSSMPNFDALLEQRLEQDARQLQESMKILSVGSMPYLIPSLVSSKAKLYYCSGTQDEKYTMFGGSLGGKFCHCPVHDASHNVHFMQGDVFYDFALKCLHGDA